MTGFSSCVKTQIRKEQTEECMGEVQERESVMHTDRDIDAEILAENLNLKLQVQFQVGFLVKFR